MRSGRDELTVGYVLKMFPRFSETFILNEILELERRGVRVVAFSMKPPNEAVRQPRLKELRARCHIIPPLDRSHAAEHIRCHLTCFRRHPGRYLATWRFARRRGTRAAWRKFLAAPYVVTKAVEEGVEHFHAHFASGPARQAKLCSFLSDIPFSFTAHAKDLFWTGHHHGENNKLKKRVRWAAFVATISAYNRRLISGLNFRVPRRRVVTIYNALDLRRWPFLRPRGRPIDQRPGGDAMILAVGRLVPKKGFHVLVEACGQLQRRGVRFRCVIAGDGPERKRLEHRVKALGLAERVHLPGSIPQDELTGCHYRQAHVLAQPSVVDADGDQDGIPTVILEALALGLPVIATDVSGIAEAVRHEETGLLIAPGDAEELARAILRILGDADLAATLAGKGRRLAETRFNLLNNSKVLIHLMRVAVRGEVRWSEQKLRERAGVTLPREKAEEERICALAAQS